VTDFGGQEKSDSGKTGLVIRGDSEESLLGAVTKAFWLNPEPAKKIWA